MSKKKNRMVWEEIKSTGMTAMIDISFLILIFLILAVKFKTREGEMSSYLPILRCCARTMAHQNVQVFLQWRKPSGYKLRQNPQQGRPVLKVGSPITGFQTLELDGRPDFVRLTRYLKGCQRRDGSKQQPSVLLDVDSAIPWNYVVQALDHILDSGLKDIAFAAKEEDY